MKYAGSYLIVCDLDDAYGNALAEYFMQRKELELQVQVCSTMNYLEHFSETNTIDILLIDERIIREEKRKVYAKKIIVLSEGKSRKIKDQYQRIYKYQSGEEIYKQFLLSCAEDIPKSFVKRNGIENDKKVIGVFSPVHRVGKTRYCINLGKKMAKTENVILLNLEIYGGIEGHFPDTKQNLSDALYFSKQEQGNLGLLLTTMVGHDDKLDFIAPMSISMDVKNVEAKDWITLIKRILKESIYEIVILDIDEGIKDVYELLQICTEIHMLTVDDPFAEAKVKQVEKELLLLKKEEILRKTKKIVREGGT